MSRDAARRVAVLIVVAFVVSSTMVVGVSAGSAQADGDVATGSAGIGADVAQSDRGGLVESTGLGSGTLQTDGDDPVKPADAIYVKDNGDAVLVYENSSDGGTAELGIDVSSNVFYALVESPVESETDVRADLTSVITPDRFTANGSLTAPRPDGIDAASADLAGVTTDQNNEFDANASVTINNTEVQAARLVQSASTSGNLSTTPTRFRTATEFQATLLSQIGPDRHEQFTLTETDGDYTVEASRNYVVSSFQADNYDTRSDARATIEAQFGAAAQQFGGSADVSIGSYSFDSDTNRLDIEFTVEYTGVEQGLAESIAAQLSASEEVDLNQSQIETFETRFQRLNIDEVSTRVDQEGTSVSGYFRVDLRNYDEWVRAGLTLAEATESEEITRSDIEAARNRLDAQAEANLRQRFEYSASLDQPDTERTIVSADLQYRTTNWAEYVDALGTRGVTAVDREYNLSARTQGDEITVEGFLEVSGREVIERAVKDGFNRSDVETTRFARALRNADLEKAKFDVRLDGSSVRFEAGAKFNNLSEARDALAETTDVPRFTEVVGRTEGDTVRSYVYVEGAVESGASESDVRALAYVDSETEVNMPNTWDREFPSMDTQRAADFLDVSLDPGDGDDEDDETGDGTTVTLEPATSRVETGGTVTYDVVVSGIDSGVGSYDIVVNSSDTSRARVVGATSEIGAGDTDVAGDGSGAKIATFNADTADTGPVTVGTVTLEGVATGDADVTVTVNSLSDESGTQYAVSSSSGSSLSVVDEIVAPDVNGDGNRAKDPDDDGRYEDVNGDGDVTPGDATVLFNAVFDNNPAVTDNAALFDFNDDGGVTPGDATVLFNEIFG